MASLTSSAPGSSARSIAVDDRDDASVAGHDSNDNDDDLTEDGQADHDQDTSAFKRGSGKGSAKFSVPHYDRAMFALIPTKQGGATSC
jgi:hypothetical protein